jgi:hypothetical protein
MNKMKENKKRYLTPKVSVVSFKVEDGFTSPGPDYVATGNPLAGPQYVETSDGYFTSDFTPR